MSNETQNEIKNENVTELVVKDAITADKVDISCDNNNLQLDETATKNANALNYDANKSQSDSSNDQIFQNGLIYQIFVILITSIIRAIAVDVFANPNKISLGGITGIGTILYNALGWNISISTFVMNVPLLIIAFFYINKRFALLTLLSTLLTSLYLQLFEFLPTLENDPLIAALISGAATGVGIGLLFKVNCSTGGTDIIGLLVQNKFPNAKVVWLIFTLNAMTGIAAGLVFSSLNVTIYSFIAILVTSSAADLLQRGFVTTFEVKIITKKSTEISDYVINNLHRSTTLMKTTGMYSGKENDYLVCIIRKRELSALKRAVKSIDPNCFMYITMVYDTIGKGFDNHVAPTSKIK